MTTTTSSHRAHLDERRAKGAEWRYKVPLSAHSEWTQPANSANPLDIPIAQGKDRVAELLPERYARMKADPFAFLRGAAAVMAADIASGRGHRPSGAVIR